MFQFPSFPYYFPTTIQISSTSSSSPSSSSYSIFPSNSLIPSYQKIKNEEIHRQQFIYPSFDANSLTDDQLKCLCLTQQQFFEENSLKFILIRIKALLLFNEGKYDEFKEYICLNKFKKEDHYFLQNLWNEANYAIASKQRNNKPLDAVSRYRIRKKNIYPINIWDGEGTSYCFKKKAREILRQYYKINSIPNIQIKKELSKQTELSILQVSNWFKNQRQRSRQYQKEQKEKLNNCCNCYKIDYAESESNQSEEEYFDNKKLSSINSLTSGQNFVDFVENNYLQRKRRKKRSFLREFC